jgi:hypothetical protein
MPSIAPFLKARQVHNAKRDKARAERRAKAVTMAARILTGEEFTNWTLAPDRSTITRFDSLSSDTRGARTYSLAGFQGQIDAQVKEILEARKKAAEAAEKAAAEAAEKAAAEAAAKTPVEVPTDTPQA